MDNYLIDFDDNPATTDSLGFERATVNLARHIDSCKMPLVIGLLGRWGSGKSTFLKLLADNLHLSSMRRKYFSVWFEPWRLEDSESLLYDLVSTIHVSANKQGALVTDSKDIATELFKDLNNIGIVSPRDFILSAVTSAIGHEIGIQDQLDEIRKLILNAPSYEIAEKRLEAITKFPENFNSYITSLSSIPIVLIDDLDRCRPEAVVNVFESLKLYLQTPNSPIIYIIAMDHEMIIRAVSNRYEFDNWRDGWQYLSKICNFIYFIPRPEIKKILAELSENLERNEDQLGNFWIFLNSQEIQELFYACNLYIPRQLKKIVRQVHMALSPNSLGMITEVNRLLANIQQSLEEKSVFEKASYRFLLGVFMLREAYPEVYSRIAYKAHHIRADFLLSLGNNLAKASTLDERITNSLGLLSENGLSELHHYFADHILLDLLVNLFSIRNYLPEDIHEEKLVSYEDNLKNELLNPLMDSLMST